MKYTDVYKLLNKKAEETEEVEMPEEAKATESEEIVP